MVYTYDGGANVGTTTVSVRLPEEDVADIERAAASMGVERSTFIRLTLGRGVQALALEAALDRYRRGEVTLSRAAEMAGLSLREVILKLRDHGVALSYGVDDLTTDLQTR